LVEKNKRHRVSIPEGCHWTSLSFPKPTWLAGPSSLFHAHYKKKKILKLGD
jgi:hypothetical protein